MIIKMGPGQASMSVRGSPQSPQEKTDVEQQNGLRWGCYLTLETWRRYLVAAGFAGVLLGGRRPGHGVGGGDGSEEGGGRREEGGHGHDVEPRDRLPHLHPSSTALSHHPHLTFVAHPGVLKIV